MAIPSTFNPINYVEGINLLRIDECIVEKSTEYFVKILMDSTEIESQKDRES